MKLKRSLVAVGLIAFALAWPTAGIIARAEEAPASGANAASALMNKIPQTAAEHEAMAKAYQEKAAQYRQDAEFHRKMLADYVKENASPLKTQTAEKSWVQKMRGHCKKYIEEAEKLAAEADQFARYHTMRAQELQGK